MPLYKRISAQYLPQAPGLEGIYEQIERAGRTCYKSDGKIQYDEKGRSLTAKNFFEKIVNVKKHRSVAEHGTIYLYDRHTKGCIPAGHWFVQNYFHNPYSKVVKISTDTHDHYYVTTNYRVLIENGWEDDLQYICEPTQYHKKRYSIRVFTDRGVSAESNRHRVNSPSERSTRFVNYGHEGAISVVVPEEFAESEVVAVVQENGGVNQCFYNMCEQIGRGSEKMFGELETWLFANLACEWSYMRLLSLGWKPQQARRVLPLDIETELVITAFEDDWIEYIGQRYYGSTGTPHPDMKITCEKIMESFEAGGLDLPYRAHQKFVLDA